MSSNNGLTIKHPYYKLKYLFGLLGVNSIIVQIILFRELFVTFSGNELSWGIFFATWLLAGALGSFTYTVLKLDINDKRRAIFVTFIFQALIFFLEIIIVRIIKTKLGYTPNEALRIEDIFMMTSGLIFLPPFIFGAMFSTIVDFTSDILKKNRHQIAGMVYSFEAFGCFVAGILFSFIFVTFLTSIEISVILFLLNLIYGYLLLNKDFLLSRTPFYLIPKKLLLKVTLLASVSIFVTTLLFQLNIFNKIDNYSYKVQWKGLNFIKQIESKYGKITVTEKSGQHNFFENSNLSFIIPDIQGVEEKVHLVMSYHDNPKTVLLLGGISQEIKELYKYDLDNITFVELDPLLLETAAKFMSHDYSLYFKERSVTSVFTDTRRYIKNTDEKYDVIILNSGEPNTLFANRYFTKEFYDRVKMRLNDGGIFSFSVTSSPNYLSGSMYFMQSSIYQTLRAAFKNIKLISSGSLTFIASEDADLSSLDELTLFDRFTSRDLNNIYFNEYLFLDLVSSEKNNRREALLISEEKEIINTDFNPKTYMLSILLLGEESGSYVTKMFKWLFLKDNKDYIIYAFIVLLGLIFLLAFFYRKDKVSHTMHFVVFTSGLTSISMEILLLFTFQIIFGYVYYKIGSLIAIFMLGLSLGSYIGNTYFIKSTYNRLRLLTALELTYLIYLICTYYFLMGQNLELILRSNVIIFTLLFTAAFISGLEFPLANTLVISNNTAQDSSLYFKTGGKLYAADLFGSCMGSLLITLILIPFFGVSNSFIFLVSIKALSFMLTFLRLVLS
jgi:spermidine synthase